MKNKAFTVVEVAIVVVIIGLLVAMAIPAFNAVRNSKDTYNAWCKMERRTDITFEEWNKLKSAGLLAPTRPADTTIVSQPEASRFRSR